MMKYITGLITILAMTLVLSSCYSVMPITNTQTATESKATGKTVIVYYDSSIGKQTPMRGLPVFLAQHAIGCCCRGCFSK